MRWTRRQEPIAHLLILDLIPTEQREDLLVEFLCRDVDAGMAAGRLLPATAIGVNRTASLSVAELPPASG